MAASGFTIVELMVALAIASVLLLALAVMFMNTSIARTELDKSSRQIESGRYAMSILSDEIQHAGYYGALANAPTAALGALPDGCANAVATVKNSISLPLQGYPGATDASQLDPGNMACLDTAAAGYKTETGVIVVKRADTSVAGSTPTSGFFNIQTSGCAGDPVRYVFDSYAASPSPFTLHANTSPGCLPLASAPAAKITPVYIRIFYISTCSETDCTGGGDGVPTLKRMDITPGGASTPVSLVDGIENMQFEYGVDSASGDGTPDSYKSAPAFADWPNVMAVRIHVLARNLDKTGGYTDLKTYKLGPVTYTPASAEQPYRRHAYSQLVRLNNPSGRRECVVTGAC